MGHTEKGALINTLKLEPESKEIDIKLLGDPSGDAR